MKGRFTPAALVIASTLLSFLLVEALYRYCLWRKFPDQFVQTDTPDSISFYNKSLWKFDRDLGYQYDFGTRAIAGTVAQGRLAECHEVNVLDDGRRTVSGNRGSDLRVFVFGDSVTAMAVNGRSWPDYLRDELERRLRKKVDVVNLGLDGIGVLQMFDIASRRIQEFAPDLIVMAFITDDITRDRIWRTTALVNGRMRLFTTTRADENPNPDLAVDTVVISPEATLEWCSRAPAPDRNNDSIIRDIERRHQLAVQLAGNRADLYSRERSFVIDKMTRGTPFRHVITPNKKAVNPRHTLVGFEEDERMKKSVETIGRTVPILLMHLVIRAEARVGKEYIFLHKGDRERLLLKSLEEMTNSKIAETMDHLVSPIDDVEAMGVTKTDDHPSEYGMKLYGEATAEAIVRRKLLFVAGATAGR